MNGFNGPALMQAGLRSLRLTPAAFWALTPAELALMLGQGAAMATPRGGGRRQGVGARAPPTC